MTILSVGAAELGGLIDCVCPDPSVSGQAVGPSKAVPAWPWHAALVAPPGNEIVVRKYVLGFADNLSVAIDETA